MLFRAGGCEAPGGGVSLAPVNEIVNRPRNYSRRDFLHSSKSEDNMKNVPFAIPGLARVAGCPIRLPVAARASRRVLLSVHAFQLAVCLICLWSSSRTASGAGIDNYGAIPITTPMACPLE